MWMLLLLMLNVKSIKSKENEENYYLYATVGSYVLFTLGWFLAFIDKVIDSSPQAD